MLKVLAAIVVGGLFCLLVATSACTKEGSTCYAGDFIACTCTNGARGYAACQPSEGLFVPCICDGKVPGARAIDAGSDVDAAPSKRAFLEACTTNEECASGICQEYPNKGSRLCSNKCTQGTATTDCPAPSGGCNNQGVCKAP
jgi:hypothetical protein